SRGTIHKSSAKENTMCVLLTVGFCSSKGPLPCATAKPGASNASATASNRFMVSLLRFAEDTSDHLILPVCLLWERQRVADSLCWSVTAATSPAQQLQHLLLSGIRPIARVLCLCRRKKKRVISNSTAMARN